MGNFSCKDCPDRSYGCHSTCEKYLREKKENEIRKARKNGGREYSEYVHDRVHNGIRKRHLP